MTKTIPLTKGFVAIIDDEDYENVSKYKWCAKVHRRTVYAVRSRYLRKGVSEGFIKLHQLIMGYKYIDHRDGDGLNCQRHNMRRCTFRESQRNQPSIGEVPYKGVSKTIQIKRGKQVKLKKPYRAGIHLENGRLHLGYHETAELAAQAYDKAARQYFGAFARLNFPMENEIGA